MDAIVTRALAVNVTEVALVTPPVATTPNRALLLPTYNTEPLANVVLKALLIPVTMALDVLVVMVPLPNEVGTASIAWIVPNAPPRPI